MANIYLHEILTILWNGILRLNKRQFGLSREFNPECFQIQSLLGGLIAYCHQPTKQMHEANDRTSDAENAQSGNGSWAGQ